MDLVLIWVNYNYPDSMKGLLNVSTTVQCFVMLLYSFIFGLLLQYNLSISGQYNLQFILP